jgi:predicted 3-demethylubiquinone-9 3-methyltransferase (glyoxalase superfamily)
MQKISPFLWFDNQAEEAANYYVSVFKNAKIISTTHYNKAGSQVSGQAEGSVMTVAFQLNGQDFTALNGGPNFTFSEAVSFVIQCDNQQEVDEYWDKFIADGGEEGQCGWLKDKFGLSWQVVPAELETVLNDPDPARAERAMQAMITMKKLDINAMKQAADQPQP